jgi:hypothetical protein
MPWLQYTYVWFEKGKQQKKDSILVSGSLAHCRPPAAVNYIERGISARRGHSRRERCGVKLRLKALLHMVANKSIAS